MTNVRYSTDLRGPSQFWGPLRPWEGIDPNDGWGHFDDFFFLNATGGGLTIEEGDDKASLATIATAMGGVARIAITGDDNEQATFQFGDAASAALRFGGTTPTGGRAWFEARVRSSSVTNNVLGMFLGVAEENSAGAADFIADDGADIADKDVIGYMVFNDDGDSVDFIYQTAGSAFGTHQAGITSLTADTWIKLGFEFDGNDKIYPYIDGVKWDTPLDIDTTGVPDGEEMCPILSVKVSSDAALNVDIDWWAFAQETV